MLLYYITDRQQFPGSEAEKSETLLARIAEATMYGVDFIQLRERDLPARDLERLAEKALLAIRKASLTSIDGGAGNRRVTPLPTKLLINSRLDVALAIGADGVHLRSGDIAASEARAVATKALATQRATSPGDFIISVSCHGLGEVRLAESHGADLALFAPVFEKADGAVPPQGIEGLHAVARDKYAARPPVPVLALGGIAVNNAGACLRAGAAGVAGIRLYQAGDLAATVKQLRCLERLDDRPAPRA